MRINITRTSFSCIFLDQSEESEKSCAIKYGPVTPECKNLTSYSESTSDSNNIEIPFDNSTVTIYDGNICFVVIAGNGTKTITVEGIHYNSGKS